MIFLLHLIVISTQSLPALGVLNTSSTGVKQVIFDTDYGPFIDDIFALGLLLNSGDLIDLKYVVTTSEQPELSAKCVAKHLDLAGRSKDVRVGAGSELPNATLRAGIFTTPNIMGFALQDTCEDSTLVCDKDGVVSLAEMLNNSDHDDWWYFVVGAQTTLRALIKNYPDATDFDSHCHGRKLVVS